MWRETNFANVFGELRRSRQADAAEILTRATGGRRISFFSQGAAEAAVRSVGEEIHTQYLLSFTPPWREANSFHALKVDVRNRPEYKVRSRAGYWDPSGIDLK